MGRDTVYYVLEFPDACSRDDFLRTVKIRHFRLLKEVQQQYGISNYKAKQAIRGNGSIGSNLYIEKFSSQMEVSSGIVLNEVEEAQPYEPSFEMSFS